MCILWLMVCSVAISLMSARYQQNCVEVVPSGPPSVVSHEQNNHCTHLSAVVGIGLYF